MGQRWAWKRSLLVLLLLLVEAAPAQAAGPLPRAGQALGDFLPHGWMVAEQVHGDLNGDGVADLAATLIATAPDADVDGATDEGCRMLLVLVSHQHATLLLAGTHHLQCRPDDGAKGGVALDIRQGVLIVRQRSGSRTFTEETWRLRYDPHTQRLLCIGRDVESGDIWLRGKVESFNYLTGLKITTTYRYDAQRDRTVTVSTQRGKGPKHTPFLEDVN